MPSEFGWLQYPWLQKFRKSTLGLMAAILPAREMGAGKMTLNSSLTPNMTLGFWPS